MSNRTFTIIKPDSVRKGNFGKIISRLEAEGFRILGLKKVSLAQQQAEGFYAVHRERPFFAALVEYMTSGPVYVAALERDDAVPHLRKVMGATDPKKADAGHDPHGVRRVDRAERDPRHRDSDENAKIEIAFFFSESEATLLAVAPQGRLSSLRDDDGGEARRFQPRARLHRLVARLERPDLHFAQDRPFVDEGFEAGAAQALLKLRGVVGVAEGADRTT